MAKKVASGWQGDVRPTGVYGKRLRRTFPTKREAEDWERDMMQAGRQGNFVPPQRDNRRLSDLARVWFELVGFELETGQTRLARILQTCQALGDPVARDADPRDFIAYRRRRLDAGISANHLNHELTYLKTVFNKLIKLGEWRGDNPYAQLEGLRHRRRQLHFLSLDEVQRLLDAMDDGRNPDVKVIARICLQTGARWGEAQGLMRRHVRAGKVEFVDTKNGDNRAVPISDELAAEIIRGRSASGRLFVNSWQAFNLALQRAGIQLPPGQKTHVLRHTFASHFMMQGGNILDLNKILGHKTLEMTMIYAHLSPEHLEVVLEKNPIRALERKLGGHNVDT